MASCRLCGTQLTMDRSSFLVSASDFLSGRQDSASFLDPVGPECRSCSILRKAIIESPAIAATILAEELQGGEELPNLRRPAAEPTRSMVWKHIKRTIKHKWHVGVAGVILGVSWWRLLKHDLSKFSRIERTGCAAKWFDDGRGDGDEAAVAEVEERALLHHHNANDHHWMHWIKHYDSGNVALEMPEAAVREMVADWAGTSYIINGHWDIVPWYMGNRPKMLLHPVTKERVASLVAQWAESMPRKKSS